MNNLLKDIRKFEKTDIKKKVKARLEEFESFRRRSGEEWFSELCFCILTANSKARTAIQIQKELGPEGLCTFSEGEVRECILRNKHRFHNNKAKYIVRAREHAGIKQKIYSITRTYRREGEQKARDWLSQNIKGLGYKEASHFMRNTGFKNLAILDRHILSLLVENGYLKEKPKSLSRKKYIEIERIVHGIAESLDMSVAELDMYMWYMKGGDVLK